jgi:hypothetical protein
MSDSFAFRHRGQLDHSAVKTSCQNGSTRHSSPVAIELARLDSLVALDKGARARSIHSNRLWPLIAHDYLTLIGAAICCGDLRCARSSLLLAGKRFKKSCAGQ